MCSLVPCRLKPVSYRVYGPAQPADRIPLGNTVPPGTSSLGNTVPRTEFPGCTKPINRTQFPRELSPPPDRIPWFEIYACISNPCMHVTFGSKSKSCKSSAMYAVSIRSVTAHLVRKSKATMITGRQLYTCMQLL